MAQQGAAEEHAADVEMNSSPTAPNGVIIDSFNSATKEKNALKATFQKIVAMQTPMLSELDALNIGKQELGMGLLGNIQVYLSLHQSMPKALEKSFNSAMLAFVEAHNRAATILVMTDTLKDMMDYVFESLKDTPVLGEANVNKLFVLSEREAQLAQGDSLLSTSKLAIHVRKMVATRYKVFGKMQQEKCFDILQNATGTKDAAARVGFGAKVPASCSTSDRYDLCTISESIDGGL